jgi:hypothetical protein
MSNEPSRIDRAMLDAIIDQRLTIALAAKPRSDLSAWLLGALKSWSMRWNMILGTLIEAWPLIYAKLSIAAPDLFPVDQTAGLPAGAGVAIAAVGMWLRQRTKTSLKAKGTTA